MSKKALTSFTGGLNNVDRPDMLNEDQLQECVNYEVAGVGRLKKRSDPSVYSSDLNEAIDIIFNDVNRNNSINSYGSNTFIL